MCTSAIAAGVDEGALSCLLWLVYFGPPLPVGSQSRQGELGDPPEVDEGVPTKRYDYTLPILSRTTLKLTYLPVPMSVVKPV